MQDKAEIEKSYQVQDPWGYQKNPDDFNRKRILLKVINLFCPMIRNALDICCGEGWITKDIEARRIYGIELSNNAAERFPTVVNRIHKPDPDLAYDLVMATGCLYAHYDWETITSHIQQAASKDTVIVISNIETWEHKPALERIPGKQIFEARFPYNEHHQKLRVFYVSST